MPYCQNCAKKVSKDDEFCPSCGERTRVIKIVKDKTERKEIIHIYKFLPDFPHIKFPNINYKKWFVRIVSIFLLSIVFYNLILFHQYSKKGELLVPEEKNRLNSFVIPFWTAYIDTTNICRNINELDSSCREVCNNVQKKYANFYFCNGKYTVGQARLVCKCK